jgi:hypothetical protein
VTSACQPTLASVTSTSSAPSTRASPTGSPSTPTVRTRAVHAGETIGVRVISALGSLNALDTHSERLEDGVAMFTIGEFARLDIPRL